MRKGLRSVPDGVQQNPITFQMLLDDFRTPLFGWVASRTIADHGIGMQSETGDQTLDKMDEMVQKLRIGRAAY